MKKSLLVISAIALFLFGCKSFKYPTKDEQGQPLHYIQISTNYGNMVVKLYNETPKHRDNMMALAKKHYYDSTMFFRVIQGFMMQGGSCDTRNAPSGVAICAARDNNPAKASSGTQFYISQGRVFTPTELRAFATSRNITFTDAQTKAYTTVGGIPQLDGNYTVYGEVIEGLNVIDSICNSPTVQYLNDRPLRDVKMAIKVLR